MCCTDVSQTHFHFAYDDEFGRELRSVRVGGLRSRPRSSCICASRQLRLQRSLLRHHMLEHTRQQHCRTSQRTQGTWRSFSLPLILKMPLFDCGFVNLHQRKDG